MRGDSGVSVMHFGTVYDLVLWRFAAVHVAVHGVGNGLINLGLGAVVW